MGRKRLPEGERQKDQVKTVILKVPNDIHSEIEKVGKSKDVIMKMIMERFIKKSD